jgi:hypothetical protein
MRKEFQISGLVEVAPGTTESEFSEKFINFVEDNGWTFGGSFREVVDDHYVNPDGSLGDEVEV